MPARRTRNNTIGRGGRGSGLKRKKNPEVVVDFLECLVYKDKWKFLLEPGDELDLSRWKRDDDDITGPCHVYLGPQFTTEDLLAVTATEELRTLKESPVVQGQSKKRVQFQSEELDDESEDEEMSSERDSFSPPGQLSPVESLRRTSCPPILQLRRPFIAALENDPESELTIEDVEDSSVPSTPHQTPKKASSKEYVGFPNLSNTCYVNACLQTLFGIPEIYASLKNRTDLHNPVQRILRVLLELRDERVIEERKLREVLQTLVKKFGHSHDATLHTFKDPDIQQDAHEYLNYLFSTHDDNKLFQNILHCRYKDGLHTCSCGKMRKVNPRSMNETMVMLSLGNAEDSSTRSLQDLLGAQYFFCDSCSQQGTCAIIFTIAPTVLALHLKRYVHKEGVASKVCEVLDLNEELDINCENHPTGSIKIKKYKLRAVIYHSGVDLKAGHYTADVRHELADSSSWFHYNDKTVSTISRPGDTIWRQSYLVFYTQD